MYTSYNRCLNLLDPTTIGQTDFPHVAGWKVWTAGATAGLTTWLISAPTELIKCQTQLQEDRSSWRVARDVWKDRGIRGLYHGGTITSIRDAVGYGFYFWSYEFGKSSLGYVEEEDGAALKVFIAGGIAGVVTWTSIYPLDVIKTKIQSPGITHVAGEQTSLVNHSERGAWSIVKTSYRQEGLGIFFRGLGVCNVRAFIVNAVQVSVKWSFDRMLTVLVVCV